MKKTLRKIALFTILTPIALLVAFALGYWIYALFAVGGESAEHQNYLKNNHETVRADANDFKLFDRAFYENRIFMLGETHGFAMPQELDFALLTHLSQKTNLTHYLAEVDYSQAYFLNQYLDTNNETLLKYVFRTWVHEKAQWGNRNFYEKIKKIRAYNQTLPQSRRIRIVGVDKIQDISVTNRLLKEIMGKMPPSAENTYLDSLRYFIATDTVNLKKMGAFAQKFLDVVEKDSAYKSSLQTDYADFTHTLRNLSYFPQKVRRDSAMFLNLKELTRRFHWENEKMYGLWGFFHVLQSPVAPEVRSFACLLRHEESVFKGKVVSMATFAVDSENLLPAQGLPTFLIPDKADYVITENVNSDGPVAFVKGIKDLKAVAQENVMTIFKLDNAGSPYRNSGLLATTKVPLFGQTIEPFSEKTVTTDVVQYVVLLRNSKALEPLNGKAVR